MTVDHYALLAVNNFTIDDMIVGYSKLYSASDYLSTCN